ncbi:MAG TPA: hypothetical protein VM370_03705 [Candidatus Thermoplasmatota archaeon]|nr:hypothetical protein [Candidatus Thermoplasmatota archaeon]
MSWQDIVLAVTAVVFFLALLPSNLDARTQISRRTSVPTAAAVWVQAATFATLGLAFSAAATFAIAIAWTHIAVWRGTRDI